MIDDDQVAMYRRVHDTSVNMLRGYLEVHSSQPEWDFKKVPIFYQVPFPNQIPSKVLNCVKALPSISNARNKLMMDMYARMHAKKPRLTEILKRN